MAPGSEAPGGSDPGGTESGLGGVRNARRTDVPAVAELRVRFHGERARHQPGARLTPDIRARSEQMLPVWMGQEGHFLLVAEGAGDAGVVAYAMGAVETWPPVLRQQRVGAITECYVDEAHRGQGLGRDLLATLGRILKAREVQALRTSVPGGLAPAQERLEAGGYAPLYVVMKRTLGR